MTVTDPTAQPEPERRIIVISDLHMTAGRNMATGLWSPTEDFFQDDEFARFLAYYRDGAPTTLVINGDLFDFLQVLEFPDEWKQDRGKGKPKRHIYPVTSTWHGREFEYSIPLAAINPVYGLRCTEEATRFLAGKVVEGHEQFFQALVDFVAREGNRIIILKGNHDIQLFWDGVQEELYQRMECLAPPSFAMTLRDRLVFKPWFHYEPGLVWIEHGNQYEYTTSFENFLVPTLPFAYEETRAWGFKKKEDAAPATAPVTPPLDDRHIELDFSSFLVRYLSNPGEPVNPLADNIRPLTSYWQGMWKEHPFFVLGTFRSGLVFMLKAFAKSAQRRRRTSRHNRGMSASNKARMAAEAAITGIPVEALGKIDACKAQPTMSQGPLPVLWWFLKPTVTGLLWLIPLAVIVSNITAWIPNASDTAGWLERTWINLLQGAALVAAGVAVFGVRHFYRRVYAALGRVTAQEARATATDALQPPRRIGEVTLDMRGMAAYISSMLDVRFVTFGHTHYADLCAIGDGRWYFNTGTWMTVLEQRAQLYREARQLTFLEIAVPRQGDPTAQLLCWYAPQGAPRRVVVLDLEELDDGIENGMLMSLLKKSGVKAGSGQ